VITIRDAALLLQQGGVVAFPTETVYGLGANALDAAAVRRIYEIKGRPATSPLIVHVSNIGMARSLSAKWPAKAEELALEHWPGPLTIVVPKASAIPDEVTAGLGTVGLRMPRHPVALELIRTAGLPLAAPSANKFTQLSPTTAEHVRAAFDDAVPVIDGGPCAVGLESTVIAVDSDGSVRLLRPGMLTIPEARFGEAKENESPGMHQKHYSPRTAQLVLVRDWSEAPAKAVRLELPDDPVEYAARLYAALHDLDAQGVERIAVLLPQDPDSRWDAVRDRLHRAASRG
jgi:L-threonylcarbamoyladenylate synthase